MKKFAAAVVIGLLTTTGAMAQTTDIAAITMVLTWIDGYMGGAATDTSFDVDRLQANIDGVIQVCSTDATANLMDVLYAAENG